MASIRTRPGEIEVSPDKPYQEDKLGREKLESPLSDLVCYGQSPFVLALDGSWGTGKTTFLNMWSQSLKNKGCHCLYFNAWETDFAEDPLLTLVSELTSDIQSKTTTSKLGIDISKKSEKVRKLAVFLAKRFIPVALKIKTAGTVDLTPEFESLLSGMDGSAVEDKIEIYEETKKKLNEFKLALRDLVEELRKEKGKNTLPIVIMIDELDRCRPNYAVELLERVKHLFDISGIVFVLGIDQRQLCHSICALYGSSFDANSYIRRFIDYSYRLPSGSPEKYSEHLFDELGIWRLADRYKNGQQSLSMIRDFLSHMFQRVDMPLRFQAQIISKLNIILQTIKGEVFPTPLAALLFLSTWNFDLYEDLISNRASADKVLDEIREKASLNNYSWDGSSKLNMTIRIIESVVLAFSLKHKQNSIYFQKYEEIASNDSGDKGAKLDNEIKALEIVQQVKHICDTFNGDPLDITCSRIALTKNFDLEAA